MTDCIFCGIAAGELEASVIHEDEHSIVLLDLAPVNQGHAIVIPREHATGLSDLDAERGGHLFKLAMRTAAAVRRSPLPCDGINVWVADGEAAGQDVFHVHLHVVPRLRGDRLRIEIEDGRDPPSREELDDVARQVGATWR